MTPSSDVDLLLVDGEPNDVQLPSAVDLEITQTDPGVRGDSVSGGGTKPATLETGAVIQVPLFLESGQRIRVDTRSGEYVARA
jgi:elongation factor P